MKFKKLIYVPSLFVFFFLSCSCYAQQNDSLVIPYTTIDSRPQNAEVFLNGEYAGETPFRILLKDSTEKQITLKKKGYFDFSLRISAADGPVYKFISLLPSVDVKPLNLVQEDKPHLFNNPGKIIPIALSALITIGSGISAYYFKSLAIENNDAFFTYGDTQAIERKKKYDRISGVSLGVFQIGLAAFLYFCFNNN
jgi:PEGA domain